MFNPWLQVLPVRKEGMLIKNTCGKKFWHFPKLCHMRLNLSGKLNVNTQDNESKEKLLHIYDHWFMF